MSENETPDSLNNVVGKGSSKKSLLIVLVILIILIGGGVVLALTMKKNNNSTNGIVNIEINPNVLSVDQIIAKYPQISSTSCPGTGTQQANCLQALAVAEKNPRYCSVISSAYGIMECKWAVAFATRDADICKLEPSTAARNACAGILNNDQTKCDSVDINFKGECYGYVAAMKSDASICDGLKGSSNINVDVCYKFAAKLLNDVSICNKIKVTGLTGTAAWTNNNDFLACQDQFKNTNVNSQ